MLSKVMYSTSLVQIERLRFMKKLYSLNLEGNPVVKNFREDVKFSSFIAAVLPNVKYYNYKFLTDAEREEGRTVFRYTHTVHRRRSELNNFT